VDCLVANLRASVRETTAFGSLVKTAEQLWAKGQILVPTWDQRRGYASKCRILSFCSVGGKERSQSTSQCMSQARGRESRHIAADEDYLETCPRISSVAAPGSGYAWSFTPISRAEFAITGIEDSSCRSAPVTGNKMPGIASPTATASTLREKMRFCRMARMA
jgi:hypothetical protein